ncbi:MAG: DUF393 domain-containing protein [candidate division WOR-3 bacterium]
MTLIYDGTCNFCKKTVSVIKKFGFRKRINFISSKDKKELKKIHFTQDCILKDFVVITDGKRILKGFYVFRSLIDIIPFFIFFQFLFHLPLFNLIGEKIYLIISKNRKCIIKS